MPASDPGVIQQLVAPAVMVPACGLLLLSTTARMNTVLARIRTFHHERLEAWRREEIPGSAGARVRALRVEGLEHQTHRLLMRARLLRLTMLGLFAAIACFLLTMLLLAARLIAPESAPLYTAAVGVFVAGVLAIVGAIVTSTAEVARILETVDYEHDRVESICATDPAHQSDTGGVADDPARGEGMGL
ncbi:MAG: DUF2721 domain-containing protein [Planctomycetota bacterium]